MTDNIQVDASAYIDDKSTITGKTIIGKNCKIVNSTIEDSIIADNVTIINSYIEKSEIKSGTSIGPYSHLRPNCIIGENVHIGNFVEVKNSTIGNNCKIAHLTYVGDAEVGQDVNFGCGVVFANYDGKNKHKTIVGNRVFIGSNVNLIAPLYIEDEAFIAAGTTVTENIDKNEFCIGRARQQNKKGMLNLYAQTFEPPLKYFGTDGIRGIYGESLTESIARKVGYALTKLTNKPRVLVGIDTRPSGKSLFNAISEGVFSGGGEVYFASVIPTPAVSYLTKLLGFDYGICITASHNPSEYNGIKIFNSAGYKLNESQELLVEKNLLEPKRIKKGKIHDISTLAYTELIKSVADVSFKNITVLIDCANGATSQIVPKIFEELGANVIKTNTAGTINVNCGVLEPDVLKHAVKESGANIGFAFDGDGDRILVCTAGGDLLDGDKLLYLFAKYRKEKYVVGTILTNYAIEKRLLKLGIKLVRCDVGDKYIAREMKSKGYKLGAEASGHVIIADKLVTGDATLAAVYFMNIFINKPKLVQEAVNLSLFPVTNINITTKFKKIIKTDEVQNEIIKCQKALSGTGRVIVRASGTEPKIRITVETQKEALAKKYADSIKNCILTELNKQDA